MLQLHRDVNQPHLSQFVNIHFDDIQAIGRPGFLNPHISATIAWLSLYFLLCYKMICIIINSSNALLYWSQQSLLFERSVLLVATISPLRTLSSIFLFCKYYHGHYL